SSVSQMVPCYGISRDKEELDKLKERVEELKKKVSSNPDSLKKTGENIDSNLEEIKKYLEMSEEVIKREAQEKPKIQTSYDNLKNAITELETEIANLEVQYKALEEKTKNIKIKYAAAGALGVIVAGITLWADKPQKEEFRHYLEQMKGEKIVLSQVENYLESLSPDNYAELIVQAKLLLITQLEQKEREGQQNYQDQKNYGELTDNLANSQVIHSFFTDLLRNYAVKFAKSKKIDISHYPLNFGGFYQGEQQDQRPLKAHYRKLAHYIQFVKHGESSCESDLGTDKYIAELAKEHEKFTGEIYQLIKQD
ncbi:1692_t:CDS:2, partial [Scutellospora calospora]